MQNQNFGKQNFQRRFVAVSLCCHFILTVECHCSEKIDPNWRRKISSLSGTGTNYGHKVTNCKIKC